MLFVPGRMVGNPAAYAPAGGPPPYTAEGVDFNNSPYYSKGSLTGVSDGVVGTFSCWFWMKGGNGANQTFISLTAAGSARFWILRNTSNQLRVFGNSGSGQVLNQVTTPTYTTSMSAYAHVAMSWDLAAGVSQIYVDGVSAGAAPSIVNTAIDYTQTQNNIGAVSGGTSLANMWVAELYMNFAAFVDLSTPANLEKFRSSGGAPVDLGADGSTPTGAQPAIFMKGPAANFGTNLGAAGNFTLTGSLSDAATDPP
jgi:hypothetical protein